VTFEHRLSGLAGLPVVEFPIERGAAAPPVEPDAVAWRVRIEADGWNDDPADNHRDFDELFAAFLERVDTTRVRALVVGMTGFECEFQSSPAVDLLAGHAADFPNLRAIFFADVLREESDVAYIEHADLMPILESFPLLEEFHVRGNVEDAYEKIFPTAVRPFRHIAAALAHAPIVARLATLDLSLGALGDEGGAALLAGQPLNHLERLDLHHHFLSAAMAERLREALPDVELDLADQCEQTTWGGQPHRYIAVSE
jgi:hypothetical protein